MNSPRSERVQPGGADQLSCHREEWLGKPYLMRHADGHKPFSSESCLLPSRGPRDQADVVQTVDLVKEY